MADVLETVVEPLTKAATELREQVGKLVAPLRWQARAAAMSYLDEQKERAANEVAVFADVMRRAAQPSNGAAAGPVGECATNAAARVGDFAELLRDRSTSAILADTEALARRQPALFLVGAIAIGFAIGYILTAPQDGAGRAGPMP
jgi:hypothetical protein